MDLALPAYPLRTDVCTFPLDGELLLFDARCARFFALDATAAYVWSSLAEGLDTDEIAAELGQASGAPHAQAKADIDALLERWRAERLLLGSDVPVRTAPPTADHADVTLIRAAAVANAAHCVLLPMAAGEGASALAAALEGGAYRRLATDVAVLDAALRLRAPPVLTDEGASNGVWLEVTAVVFAARVPSAATVLRPLSRAAALVRLMESDGDWAARLDKPAAAALVRRFGALRCYELRFDRLDQAVEAFAAVAG
jgi:hypothetical protein